MSRKPVVYRLESKRTDATPWLPVLDEHRQPMTFTGPQGKAHAVSVAVIMLRWPSFFALRVMKSGDPEPVKTWTKHGGVSQ